MVVVRKNISVEQGAQRRFDEMRYVFDRTTDREPPAAEGVFLAKARCDQENLIAWNPWQAVFLRGFDQWREPVRSCASA